MSVPSDFPADVGILSDGTIVYGSNWNLMRDQVLALCSPPACKYYRASGVGIASATWTSVFGSITGTTPLAYDNAGFGTSGSPLTMPIGGVYRLTASFEFAAASSGNVRSVRFNVNSGAVYLGRRDEAPTGASVSTSVAATSEWIFNAGDQVIVEAYQDSGASLNVAPDVTAAAPDFGSIAITWIGIGT